MNDYLINQLIDNGGLFNYNTNDYLFNGGIDHVFDEANHVSLSYRFAHDLDGEYSGRAIADEFSGSWIHNYDNNLQGSWFHTFNPRTQNRAGVRFNSDSFNVIPNTPASVGLQIPGFANNLGDEHLPAEPDNPATLGICRQRDDDSRKSHDSIRRGRDSAREPHGISYIFAWTIRVRPLAWGGTEPLLPSGAWESLILST